VVVAPGNLDPERGSDRPQLPSSFAPRDPHVVQSPKVFVSEVTSRADRRGPGANGGDVRAELSPVGSPGYVSGPGKDRTEVAVGDH
jgi:hypothetical protein